MRPLLLAASLLILVFPLFAQPAPLADLSADFFFPERITVSEQVNIFGYVQNRGPDAAKDIVVTTTAGRFMNQGCSSIEGNRCTIDYLASGEGQLLFIVVDRELAEGRLPITVEVTGAVRDPNPRNDRISGDIALTLGPDMSIYLYGETADPGQTAKYTVSIYNQSPIEAQNPTFSMILPEGWSFERSLSEDLRCSADGRNVTCSIERLAPSMRSVTEILVRAPNVPQGQVATAPVSLTTDHGLFEPRSGTFTGVVYRHLAVTHTGDDGEGSLRSAITRANADCMPGPPCKVVFDIAGEGTHRTIRPLTPLPVITTFLSIDGSWQTKRHGDTNPLGPEIEINGSLLSEGNGIEATSQAFELRHVAVNGFPGNGVVITTVGYLRLVEHCYIGTDVTGQAAVPNRGRGLVIDVSMQYYSAGATIRNNVISGNGRSGIFAPSGFTISISGNRIGTTAGERAEPLGNGASGIYLGPGTSAVTVLKNVIAYNAEAGIAIAPSGGYINMVANSISNNGTVGIDYGIDLVTPNPPPNQYSSFPTFPVLTSARYDEATGITRIEGTIERLWSSSASYLELFASSSPGQHGQGDAELFIGRIRPQTNNFTFDYKGDLRGRFISATHTHPNSYYPEIPYLLTSEISASVKVEGEAAGPIDRAVVVPRGADLGLRIFTYRFNAGMPATVYASIVNYGPATPKDIVVEISADEVPLRVTDRQCEQVGRGLRCRIEDSYKFTFGIDVPFDATKITIRGRATSSEFDPDLADNEVVATADVLRKPEMDARVESPGPVDGGATASYSVWVANHTAVEGRDVELRMPLANGWSFVSDSSPEWNCGVEGPDIVCRTPVVEGLSQQSFSFTVRAPNTESYTREVTYGRLYASGEYFYTSIYVGFQTFHILRVTNTSDEGTGSLRDALTRANEECNYDYDPKPCKVAFSIDASSAQNGVFTIRPTRPLPAVIANDLVIDGRTQTAHTGDTNPLGPEIELNGSLTRGSGLEIDSNGATIVRGLVINGFPDNGVVVRAPEQQFDYRKRRQLIENYIGTDPTGTIAVPNGGRGIVVETAGERTTHLDVIASLISGNGRAGIFASAANNMRIIGNRVVRNGASGIYLGRTEGVQVESNEISNNAHAGIGLDRSARFNSFRGNATYDNGGLGIDHGLDLVTFNDALDRAENLPPFPIITSAVWDESAKVTRIEGRAAGSPLSRDVVELFANAAPDATGYGEAQRPIGIVRLSAAQAEQTFSFVIAEDLRGTFVTATLTRGYEYLGADWTSEIGQAVPVQ